MELNEAIDILKEAKFEVEKEDADFNYKLTEDYVIFPTVEDVVKCFCEDSNKGYTYVPAHSNYAASIGIPGTNDVLTAVDKKTKEGYWIERDVFYYDFTYQVNEKQDILLNVSFPVLNQKGKSLSFDTFMKRRKEITTKITAYNKYSEELKALAAIVKKRMTEMARIFKINA